MFPQLKLKNQNKMYDMKAPIKLLSTDLNRLIFKLAWTLTYAKNQSL